MFSPSTVADETRVGHPAVGLALSGRWSYKIERDAIPAFQESGGGEPQKPCCDIHASPIVVLLLDHWKYLVNKLLIILGKENGK